MMFSNYNLDNIDELNREIKAFNRMCNADPAAVTRLKFKVTIQNLDKFVLFYFV